MSTSTRRLALLLLAVSPMILLKVFWLPEATKVLLPPLPLRHDLDHLRRERSLKHYLDNIKVLIEPSLSLYEDQGEVPLLVLVASSPSRLEHRSAVRETWGSHLPTFFVLGLEENLDESQDDLKASYVEAKIYSDLIVFDFAEDYQNLTLKTALMLQWSQRRFPQADAVMKTDDDVLINPWVMMEVVKEHSAQQLVGYKFNEREAHREEYSKWYLPRWLYPQDTISEYLSGTGYIIYGDYIAKILKGANKVPLINLEDVYFTHCVAKVHLGLTLTHDQRLSPFKPWLRLGCAFWGLAMVHSLTPDEMVTAWGKIAPLGKNYDKRKDVCDSFRFLSSDLFLY